MPAMPRRWTRLPALALTLALSLSSAACARPYRGPKTLAAIGVGVLATSATLWVLGERQDRRTLQKVGVAGSLVGAGLTVGAGGWLAASAGCIADPDCPDDEVCREIPAPPGREPYKQCMPR
jgi:hypothetical protein